jgi:hypothetical protein
MMIVVKTIYVDLSIALYEPKIKTEARHDGGPKEVATRLG